jgi:hypothetical protein
LSGVRSTLGWRGSSMVTSPGFEPLPQKTQRTQICPHGMFLVDRFISENPRHCSRNSKHVTHHTSPKALSAQAWPQLFCLPKPGTLLSTCESGASPGQAAFGFHLLPTRPAYTDKHDITILRAKDQHPAVRPHSAGVKAWGFGIRQDLVQIPAS